MKVSFILPSGEVRTVPARGGQNLMEVAVNHSIDGIEGECGGACSCATCLVQVSPAWVLRVGAAGGPEADMVSECPRAGEPGIRLACQIVLKPELDGLEVEPVLAGG